MRNPTDDLHFFAAVGDVHGYHTNMTRLLRSWEKRTKRSLRFVLQVGDFEPHRNEEDLQSMAAPSKLKTLGDWPLFEQGRKTLPWPVWFIGGNHEPYAFLEPLLPHTEIAPNAFWLGRSTHLQLGPLAITALSGIEIPDATSTQRPHHTLFGQISNRAWIHFTHEDLNHALDAPKPDILILHEWPAGIIAPEDRHLFYGIRRAPRPEDVGSPLLRDLLNLLEPKLVVCGHMHLAYRAYVSHSSGVNSHICALGHVGHKDNARSVAFFAYHPTTNALYEDVEGTLMSLS